MTEWMLGAAQSGELRTNGSGDDFVSLVTAADVAAAVVLAVDGVPSGTTLNVVDDEPLRERDLFARVARFVGGPPPQHGPEQPGWGSVRLSNRLARSFGFRPRHPDVIAGLSSLVPSDVRASFDRAS